MVPATPVIDTFCGGENVRAIGPILPTAHGKPRKNVYFTRLAFFRRVPESMKCPRYSTTVIGAYSVPDWYEALDRLVSVGQLSMGAMADAQFRAGEGAVHDQELAGIDVVTGGEMHRRTHNRHSPPNAMLNYFWQKIPAFQGSTRPKPITLHDPDVFHPAATCRDRINDTIDLGLADEFKMVSRLTNRPVKVTMTGPHMLSKVAYDEYYGDM